MLKYLKQLIQKLKPKIPIYGNRKLIASLEYGLIIADVAKKQGVELTKEMVESIEKMILTEFKAKNVQRLAIEMVPNILSCFEIEETL